MLRYVTLRYVTLRYVTLRYVTLHYVMLRYVELASRASCALPFFSLAMEQACLIEGTCGRCPQRGRDTVIGKNSRLPHGRRVQDLEQVLRDHVSMCVPVGIGSGCGGGGEHTQESTSCAMSAFGSCSPCPGLRLGPRNNQIAHRDVVVTTGTVPCSNDEKRRGNTVSLCCLFHLGCPSSSVSSSVSWTTRLSSVFAFPATRRSRMKNNPHRLQTEKW